MTSVELMLKIHKLLPQSSQWWVEQHAFEPDNGYWWVEDYGFVDEPYEYTLYCLPPTANDVDDENIVASSHNEPHDCAEAIGDFIEQHGEEAGSLLRYRLYELMVVWWRYDDRIGGHMCEALWVNDTQVYKRQEDK